MKYTLKAYKPNSEDYCMGCHMASYESDCIEKYDLSEDELIKKIAEIEAIELGMNEAVYDISYYIYQPIPSISDKKREEIDKKSALLAKEIKEEREKEKVKLERQKEKERLEKEKQKELATFEALKEKYE